MCKINTTFQLVLTCTNKCRLSNGANHDESTVAEGNRSRVTALLTWEESFPLSRNSPPRRSNDRSLLHSKAISWYRQDNVKFAFMPQ